MKEKQKNVLLAAFALMLLKEKYGVKPDQVIPNYNKEKSANFVDEQLPDDMTEDQLKELAIGCYKRLKIN